MFNGLQRQALAAALGLGLTASLPAAAAETALWRLDCGQIEVADMAAFSDTFHGAGSSGNLANSCYLIRHGTEYMLWDAGLPASLKEAPMQAGPLTARLEVTLAEQLAQIGVAPEAITKLGISHYHFDHLGQASHFAGAELLIAAADLAALREGKAAFAMPDLIAPWLAGEAQITEVQGDFDVYGDRSVVMLKMPGHTPGSMALLVNLSGTGPVLLSGDVVHFEDQFARQGVPPFNHDRADSLASMARLQGLAEALQAKLVIQHDPDHVARLPAFPEAAH